MGPYLGNNAAEQGFQVRSGWPGWARRNWMGWSWMGWLLHRLKLALKCCGLLADIPAEFRVRSWGPSLPVPVPVGPGVGPPAGMGLA